MIRLILAAVIACLSGSGHSAAAVEAPVPPAENTVWFNCYDEDGHPDMAENATQIACPEAAPLFWGELPLRVWIDPEVDAKPVLQAFDVWKSWLGTEVFRQTDDLDTAQVMVLVDAGMLGLADCEGAAACAPHERLPDGSFIAGVIFHPDYMQTDIAAHELGHTLGLAHDHDLVRSVMYPSADWVMPQLTATDRDALCSLYRCGS